MITVEEFKSALPVNLRASVTDELLNKLNNVIMEAEEAEAVAQNIMGYTTVLKEGRFKVDDYLHAVIYVSKKLMGMSNQEAWKQTFPERHGVLALKGASEKEISAYVSAYNKGKLVNLIMEQVLIPSWILNAHHFQDAINVQVELMNDNTVSPKVRTEAANSLLTHLKRPETKKVEIDLSPADNSGVNALRDMMAEMAQLQIEAISKGVPTQTVAHQKLPMKDITPEA